MKKFMKVALYGGCFATALLIGAHYTWKLSGSDQWRLVSDRDGVRVYEMKERGSAFMKYKATMRMKSTMNRIVAGMMDREAASVSRRCSPGISRISASCTSIE
jgi:hypothetical protein